MSISTIQEKLLNKGCGSAFIVLAGAILGLTFITGQCGNSARMNESASGRNGKVVVNVGDVPVISELIEARASRLGATDVQGQAFGLALSTGQVLRQAGIQDLLGKGAAPTEAEITQAATQLGQQTVERARQQLQQQGKLKATASQAEFEQAFKAQTGKTLAQTQADFVSTYVAAYKDPSKKSLVLDDLGEGILAARTGAKKYPSDDALKATYKNYVVRRVFFSAQSGSTESPEARAAKALSDLKAGKSFDTLMDTVSNDPPAPGGKKPHEVTTTLTAEQFAAQPYLADLKDKPANSTTGVVDVPGGKAIYQLVTTQDAVPADFAKNAGRYRTEKARGEVDRQVKQLLASNAVTWKSQGYHALAQYAEAAPMGFPSDPSAAKQAFTLGQSALKSDDPSERRLGAMAMLLSSAPSPFQVQGAAQPSASADRIAAIEAVRSIGLDDATLGIELAKAYGEKKDGANATQALLWASKSNTQYDAAGQKIFGDIAAQALKLQSAKVITAAQLAQVQGQQATWSTARSANEAASAEAKRQQAEQEKANAAEIKRQEEEAAKNKPKAPTPASSPAGAASKPDATSTSTSGSATPATAGAGR